MQANEAACDEAAFCLRATN